jgi:SAM-dependent methyltransferase
VNFAGRKTSDIRILDWGCGKGQLSYFLHKKGYRDITVAEVADYPHTKLWNKIDATRLILDDPILIKSKPQQYDIIISAGVLEHVPYDQASLQELQRLLKPDGALFCFNLPSNIGYIHRISHLLGDYYHDRLYSKREIKFILKRSGLKPLVMYRRQLFPKKALNYKNPSLIDVVDNRLSIVPVINLPAASVEFIAVNQNCHQQAG